uniref:Uncharacterized protein n=1 Tax=Anguilla anguilla TaxID=7936 RepID=A0A0E9WEF1_ANGAN
MVRAREPSPKSPPSAALSFPDTGKITFTEINS